MTFFSLNLQMLLGEHNLVWDKIQQMHSMAQLENQLTFGNSQLILAGGKRMKLTKN